MGEWHENLIKKIIPVSYENIKKGFDGCHIKNELKEENYLTEQDNISISSSPTFVKCNQWVYSKKYFESTLNSEV